MKIESYLIGAYWGPREETVEACAERLCLFLECLGRCDPLFEDWFEKGRSRKDDLKRRVQTNDRKAMEALLLKGRIYSDDGRLMEDLGFQVGLWTGDQQGEVATLSVSCGSYALRPGINSCVIKPPPIGAGASRILQVQLLTELVRCVVSAWEPNWGVVTSSDSRDLVYRPHKRSPVVGWLTYLSTTRGKVPSMELPVQIKSIGDLGVLIVITDDRFTIANPDQIALANQVARLLEQHHLMEPL